VNGILCLLRHERPYRIYVELEQAFRITVPVVRAYHGTRSISEMEINDRSTWRDKLVAT